jgi:hypothetical protein
VQRRQAASAGQQREQKQRADDEPSEHDHRGLEHIDAELDEQERRSPDRGQQQQEEGVAATHGFDEGKRSAGAEVCGDSPKP